MTFNQSELIIRNHVFNHQREWHFIDGCRCRKMVDENGSEAGDSQELAKLLLLAITSWVDDREWWPTTAMRELETQATSLWIIQGGSNSMTWVHGLWYFPSIPKWSNHQYVQSANKTSWGAPSMDRPKMIHQHSMTRFLGSLHAREPNSAEKRHVQHQGNSAKLLPMSPSSSPNQEALRITAPSNDRLNALLLFGGFSSQVEISLNRPISIIYTL